MLLTRVKNLLERNKLGELLVLKGDIKPEDLKYALKNQKQTNASLGSVLLKSNLVTKKQLRRTLYQQTALRVCAAMAVFIVTFASTTQKSKAASFKDVPGQLRLASAANSAFSSMSSHTSLYGTNEQMSQNLKPFTKWTGMFKRFEAATYKSSDIKSINKWRSEINTFSGMDLTSMATKVNSYVNEFNYVTDNKNYGDSDYWATPVEFFSRGGDCEDFAIAKYASLRALGVPESRLRIAIVQDLQKNIPHAVLVVYTDQGALVLDNQNKRVSRVGSTINRYKPIFTINQQGWWLHTAPQNTVVALR